MPWQTDEWGERRFVLWAELLVRGDSYPADAAKELRNELHDRHSIAGGTIDLMPGGTGAILGVEFCDGAQALLVRRSLRELADQHPEIERLEFHERDPLVPEDPFGA